MFFQLPLSGPLSKAFMGTRAWAEAHAAAAQADAATVTSEGDVDVPGQTYDGYTLFVGVTPGVPGSRVSLLDMHRREVHRWTPSFSRIWPNPPHLDGRQVSDAEVCVFACHLYPNGDLLVVFHGMEKTIHGYGLAKIDKDSNLIWSYAANAHHDVTVGEDGTIYTLIQKPLTAPIKGLEYVPTPWLVDHVAMLSPEGKELRPPISLLDALRESPYATLLSPLETGIFPVRKPTLLTDEAAQQLRNRQDVCHTNSVAVLPRSAAASFPAFHPGDILVSMRGLHALALINPQSGKAVWGACGPWHMQHDGRFLDSGRIMLFDNFGTPRGSRVLEFDPKDGSFPWSYPGADQPPIFTKERGMAQRLPNGNTLIAVSEANEMIEVTSDKKVVWSCNTNQFITTARRYGPEQVSFLPADRRPRN